MPKQSAPDPIELGSGIASESDASMPALLTPPEGVEAILVIPGEEVSTEAARAALPADVPLADAAFNVGAASQLVLGIERSDLGPDRARPRRPPPPAAPRGRSTRARWRSSRRRRGLGAIGATISGAGPTVLVWSFWQSGAKVSEGLAPLCEGWAEVRRVPFSARGARVEIP